MPHFARPKEAFGPPGLRYFVIHHATHNKFRIGVMDAVAFLMVLSSIFGDET
jgi:hypothetical protein